MAIESVRGPRALHSVPREPIHSKVLTESTRHQLETNHWVCDFEMHQALWQAQSIMKLAGDALEEGNNRELAQQAIYGAERLLVNQIERTGWGGIEGGMWQRVDATHTPAAAERES